MSSLQWGPLWFQNHTSNVFQTKTWLLKYVERIKKKYGNWKNLNSHIFRMINLWLSSFSYPHTFNYGQNCKNISLTAVGEGLGKIILYEDPVFDSWKKKIKESII